MEQRKFIFIRDYETERGTFKKGSEITLFRGLVFFNGGMLSPGHGEMMLDIIRNDAKEHLYLQEVKVISHKI